MAEYKYFEDFQLGIYKLSDFNGTIINNSDDKRTINLLPDIEHVTETNSNCDGEAYIKSRRNPKIINIPVMFSKEGVYLNRLTAWLGETEQQTFNWISDEEKKEIDVIYDKGFDMGVYYGGKFYGQMDLSFIAHDPLWRIKNEHELKFKSSELSTTIPFRGKGNIKCKPTIRLKPNGSQAEIKFRFNDMEVKIKNISNEFYIECGTGEVYEMINGIKVYSMTKYFSDEMYNFPIIYPFKVNTFTLLNGSLTELGITLNSKINGGY
ncbi:MULTISPECIES: phage tail domain-containing protein [unclassified Clostridium]|uniref:phage tail domain-containing protein n=1 Tax=unclassified Clostridium TaxID=2614128 RepID=UPI0020799CDD|nr:MULTISPECIES: phage tail domain-containing protein [unclassified Clostridium]